MTRGLGMQTVGAAIVMCSTLPAMADGFGFSFGYEGRHHRHHVGVVVERPVVVHPAPVVLAPAQPIWIAPVYRTVSERVWVPTSQTTFRDVPVYDRWGRVVGYRRQAFNVASGYWTTVTKQVLVREGYWTAPVGGGVVAVPTERELDGGYNSGEPAPQEDNDDSDTTYRGTDAGRPARGGATTGFVR